MEAGAGLSASITDAAYAEAGAEVGSAAQVVKGDFDAAFEKVDALVAPTSPTVAFKFGARLQDPVAMYLSDVYTATVNLAGLPAITVPAGRTDGGLPIGLQAIGRDFGEALLFRVAGALERAFGTLVPPS